MPIKPLRPCKSPFCRNTTDHFSGWCEKCYKPENYRSRKRAKPERYDSPKDKYKWLKFSKDFLSRFPLCVKCHRPAQVTDHRIPWEILIYDLGYDPVGEDEFYQAMCIRCNTAKGRGDKAQVKAYLEKYKLSYNDFMGKVYGARWSQFRRENFGK